MDTYIDPTTRDYAPDPAAPGVLLRDPAAGLANAVYLRLMTPLGSWWADANFGSMLYKLNRAKAVNNIDVLAKGYAASALQPLLDDGRAQSIDISTELQTVEDGSKRLGLLVTVVDAAGNTRVFDFFTKVI